MSRILHLTLLAYVIQFAKSDIWLEPKTATALRGSEVRFNCSTDGLWDVMNWQLNGGSVLPISRIHGPLVNDGSVWAVNHSTSAASVWEMVLRSVGFIPGPQMIICEILSGNNQRQTATLWVQEIGTVAILGGNITAQERESVALYCHAVGWYPLPTVGWRVNGAVVNDSEFNTSSVQDPTGLFNLTSVLLLSVEENYRVECLLSVPVLSTPLTSKVSVSVVSRPKVLPNSIVIAVTVTLCTIILLIFIVLLFFCRRKLAESKTYKDEVRIGQQDSGKNYTAEETEGKDNFGYRSEGPTGCCAPCKRFVQEWFEEHENELKLIDLASKFPRSQSNPPAAYSTAYGHQTPDGITDTSTSSTQEVPDSIFNESNIHRDKSALINEGIPRYVNVRDFHAIQRRDVPKTVRQITTV